MPAVINFQNKFFTAFRRAPSGRERTHLDENSRLVILESSDPFEWKTSTITEISCRGMGLQDANLGVISDNKILLHSFLWKKIKNCRNPSWRYIKHSGFYWQCCGIKAWTSSNFPAQLEESKIFCREYSNTIAGRGQIAGLADRILLPAYGIGKRGEKCGCLIMCSCDHGKTFQKISDFHIPDFSLDCYEPSLCVLPDQNIAALVRTQKHLFIWKSNDLGSSWHGPEICRNITGHPFQALDLPDGRKLIVWGRREKPYGIFAALCDPFLKNIGRVKPVLITATDSANCGYPWSCMAGKYILTVYYLSRGRGVTYIGGALYKPAELGYT